MSSTTARTIRIHELAKKITLGDGEFLARAHELGHLKDVTEPLEIKKALCAVLKEMGCDVKSVSSTVGLLISDEILDKFAGRNKAPAPAPAEPPPPPAPKPRIPMVKTAEDVQREKEAARLAAEKPAAVRPAPPPPPAASRAPAPVSAPKPVSAPRPVSVPPRPAPALLVPPAGAPAGKTAPAPLRTPGLRAPAPAPAPAAPRAPAPKPAAPAPRPAPAVSAPRPVSAPRTPLPPPAAQRPAPAAPAVPGAAAPLPANVTISEEAGIKVIHIKPPIILRDFAITLGLRPFKLISELMETGIFASMNQAIDEAVAARVAEKHGFLLEIRQRGAGAARAAEAASQHEKEKKKKAAEEEARNLAARPPVVCILGHVDHGKTSLLDAIRKAEVAAGEAGGITQHIGAYQVEHAGKKITFLDTPGHAAFNKMRARGASLTDIAILVVAADDGFMPQTDEALKYIKDAGVALMVAVNKMDVKGANLDRVKTQLQERGVASEDWGGTTLTVPVSATKGTGVTDLLDAILLQAEMLELKANPKAPASGVIIESQIDPGRGPLATVIIQRGTLRSGDALLCGPNWARARALFDDQGRPVKEAPPSAPVRIIGWSGTPESGAVFTTAKNAREAEKLADAERHRLKQIASQEQTAAAAKEGFTVEDLFKDIAAQKHKTLKILIKTDVFGSTEAVRSELERIKSNKVSLEIVGVDVGVISKSDVLMAASAGAAIIGFNTRLENGVTPLAKHHGVRVETYGIIYELADKVRDMMADLLDPDIKEIKTGAAEVRATFEVGKGFVAGCLVTEGKINRNAPARVRRKKDVVFEGKIGTLKRFKDDANEVRAGLECGIKVGDFNGYEIGDVIECHEIQKVRASL